MGVYYCHPKKLFPSQRKIQLIHQGCEGGKQQGNTDVPRASQEHFSPRSQPGLAPFKQGMGGKGPLTGWFLMCSPTCVISEGHRTNRKALDLSQKWFSWLFHLLLKMMTTSNTARYFFYFFFSFKEWQWRHLKKREESDPHGIYNKGSSVCRRYREAAALICSQLNMGRGPCS